MTFKERVKDLLGIAKPGGIDDVIVRAIKTGVAVLLSSPFIIAVGEGDLDFTALEPALLAAASAAGSVVINAVLAAAAKFASD